MPLLSVDENTLTQHTTHNTAYSTHPHAAQSRALEAHQQMLEARRQTLQAYLPASNMESSLRQLAMLRRCGMDTPWHLGNLDCPKASRVSSLLSAHSPPTHVGWGVMSPSSLQRARRWISVSGRDLGDRRSSRPTKGRGYWYATQKIVLYLDRWRGPGGLEDDVSFAVGEIVTGNSTHFDGYSR